MTLEFFGESGSGKTTVARALVTGHSDSFRLCPNMTKGSIIGSFLRNCFKPGYINLLRLLLKLGRKHRSGRAISRAAILINCADPLFSGKRQTRAVVTDQGLIQYFSSVFFGRMPDENDREIIKKAVTEIVKRDVAFIFVKCQENILRERILKRAGDASEKARRIEEMLKDSDAWEAFYRDRTELWNYILSLLPAERLIEAESTGDAVAPAEEIYARWKELTDA